MITDLSPRDKALRRILVAAVDAEPVQARRPRALVAAAAVAAFGLAGALTGGALATATAPDPVTQFGGSRPPIFDDDVRLLSAPLILTGRAASSADLGPAPDGANALAIAIYCLDYGSYRVNLDGAFEMGMACTPEPGRDAGGGGGGISVFDAEPPRMLSVDVEAGEYAVWAAWVFRPADAEPSAAQTEALADGIVTREEYVAGFERYRACLEGLGIEVYGGDTSREIIDYALPGSAGGVGAANRCYDAEFRLVDSEWQVAHER